MFGNAFFATTIVCLALGILLLEECRFLIPYRHLLFATYAGAVVAFSAALFLNLFAAFYLVCRKLFLKDTGRKLAHVEKQLRTGASISEELSRRLKD